MRAILHRDPSQDKQTLGGLILSDPTGKTVFTCKTLELPWLANARRKSCIPKGTYNVVPRHSDKYGPHLHITNVPKRDAVLIHSGNYFTQILGCILVGSAHSDINKDGYKDVVSSRKTLDKLVKLAPEGFTLTIQ